MYILSTSDQLGYQLVARRKALGLTQQEVASRLGISQNRLSELESQPSQLTVERLLALTGILGLELAVQQRSQAPLSTSEW
ncbi:helix-turn-helix domain-containing protein [Alcaligenes faecalis]|jgi:HTH-type transcriptional regulator/antitoxin HipB|uniref:Helix-turn-helix domain-containing protein n=2 Tax=Alcaligenes TaxID=507 RepID=A0AAE9H7H1_ALCFA|nr:MULTISPECIES: helix-turn-helix domain-containing protein [Alcaligenes]MCM2558539.1 helix-turn-helix domain-containing protein [Alcaligenes faecalis]MCM2621945.1 helix-turn-helix domain-containing protein [Alcaligenes faecalis]MCR4143804.1 helix-turn-helix domain-containing protein [Alcaligenes faecalis]MCX5471976.1 helix-turn-helix domain-containing protein [Alcaligenes nematophilus]MCX5565030.1 helix-turn-helix domain-containing protein [Alcaligenes phenolicus]